MQEDNNHYNDKVKLEHRVTSLEVCQEYIQSDLTYIKRQVDNHIPSQIQSIDEKVDKFIRSNQKQFIGILISIVLLLLSVLLGLIKLKIL